MDTVIDETESEFMTIVKKNDITELRKYFKEQNFTLNEFYDLVKANKKSLKKYLKSKEASSDIKMFFMRFVGEKRKNIIEILKHDSLVELKQYIIENNISLKGYNTRDFDLLLTSIENNVSPEVMKYVIKQCQYTTFNYTIQNSSVSILQRTPIFSAIAKNNFSIAKLLIECGADVNYSNGDLLYCLYYLDLIEPGNLKFILNHGINLDIILEFISFLIKDSPFTIQNIPDLLKVIISHYIYSNSLILMFLLNYKNRIPLSTEKIQEEIENEANKIIKDQFYQEAVYYEFEDGIELLLGSDVRDKIPIYNKIKEYKKQGTYSEEEYDDEGEEEEEGEREEGNDEIENNNNNNNNINNDNDNNDNNNNNNNNINNDNDNYDNNNNNSNNNSNDNDNNNNNNNNNDNDNNNNNNNNNNNSNDNDNNNNLSES